MSPEFPDGLIKSATCYNKPIYKEGKNPNKDTIQLLIKTYYDDYHKLLKSALLNSNIVLALDCHSMAEVAPEISPSIP